MPAARWLSKEARQKLLTLVVPGLAVFLCCLTIVIKPLGRLGNQYGYLSYTILIVFFCPGGTLGAQLEATVVGVIGCFVGLGYASVLIKIATVWNKAEGGQESTKSRVLGAFGLLSIACVSGYLRSSAPRITTGARIALFHSIFLLTTEMGRVDLPPSVVLSLLYPTLFAAGSSLLARLLFPTTAVSRFLALTQQSFFTSERLLLATVDDFFTTTPSITGPSARIKTLRAELVSQSATLPTAYDSTVFEISLSRFSPHRLLPFLRHVRNLKMDLGSYSPSPTPPSTATPLQLRSEQTTSSRITLVDAPGVSSSVDASWTVSGRESTRSTFEAPTRDFVSSLVDAFGVVHQVLKDSASGRRTEAERRKMVGARERLMSAEVTFGREMDERLEQAVRSWEMKVKRAGGGKKVDGELLRIGLFSYSIREIARTLDAALGSAQQLSTHTSAKPTLRWPRIGRRWLNKSSVSAEWTEAGRGGEQPDDDADTELHRVRTELQTSVAEALLGGTPTTTLARPRRHWSARRMISRFCGLWDSDSAVRARVYLGNIHTKVTARRHHLQYALKVGLGIILLSLPAFLSPASPGRIWWLGRRGQWQTVSYLYVLEASAGATWKIALFRVLGTMGGSILGCIISLICHNNPYALTILTTLYGILSAYIMLHTPTPGIGVVASITLPPLLYIPYLGLPHKNLLQIAYARTSDVAIGIAAALIVTELVYPSHSQKIFLSSMATALDELTQLYISMSRENLSAGVYNFDRSVADEVGRSVERTLARGTIHLTSVKTEFTLVHKPIRIYRRVIACIQKLNDLLLSISLIREKIPRDTVTKVLRERRELISSLLVHIFACSHAFRSQLPLPQFLSSPGDALRDLEAKALRGLVRPVTEGPASGDLGDLMLEDRLGEDVHRDPAFLYAFAEAQALEAVVKVVEELTELTRALFGSATFWEERREERRDRSPAG